MSQRSTRWPMAPSPTRKMSWPTAYERISMLVPRYRAWASRVARGCMSTAAYLSFIPFCDDHSRLHGSGLDGEHESDSFAGAAAGAESCSIAHKCGRVLRMDFVRSCCASLLSAWLDRVRDPLAVVVRDGGGDSSRPATWY